jgi:hypothetical protein
MEHPTENKEKRIPENSRLFFRVQRSQQPAKSETSS